MKIWIILVSMFVTSISLGCSERDRAVSDASDGKPVARSALPLDAINATRKNQENQSIPGSSDMQSSAVESDIPPTAEELGPIFPKYALELAKIDEPPEMANKPMHSREASSTASMQPKNVLGAVGAPEKATHSQRLAEINHLLAFLKTNAPSDSSDRANLYATVAMLSCVDGADPLTTIGYANHAVDDEDSGLSLALRARMYLRAGKISNSLDDLEKIMAHRYGSALVGNSTDPRKETSACGWSTTDFDSFGSDPRGLAAKGYYLSAFLGFGARARGSVKEADIRNLYQRSATSWSSPIPHYLGSSLDGLGSIFSMSRARCTRQSDDPETIGQCAKYDQELHQKIRALTMALLIEPGFLPARSARAGGYLQLAQNSHADGKPARKYFELAINDFNVALAEGSQEKHVLYCDRALAQASIGKYREAALGYMQGMKYALNGVERDSFVYLQLAGVYFKMGQFNEAATVMTQAIMNVAGGGMDIVILGGGINGFRILYPEYDMLPDEILADVVRRRYFPNFPKKWNDEFISGTGFFKGKVLNSTLPELYIKRGDAYMRTGHREKALADYNRVKSEAWGKDAGVNLRKMYFNENGSRNVDFPEPFPLPPAVL